MDRITKVMAEFVEDTPVQQGGVWAVNSRHTFQPVRLLGTPFCKYQSNGIRMCGSGPKPGLPVQFGNYSDTPFQVAAAMRFFGLRPRDIDEFKFVVAGVKLADQPDNCRASYFDGLTERVALAYRVLENAPWLNYLVWGFRKTEKWQTVFKGSIPLTWAK